MLDDSKTGLLLKHFQSFLFTRITHTHAHTRMASADKKERKNAYVGRSEKWTTKDGTKLKFDQLDFERQLSLSMNIPCDPKDPNLEANLRDAAFKGFSEVVAKFPGSEIEWTQAEIRSKVEERVSKAMRMIRRDERLERRAKARADAEKRST